MYVCLFFCFFNKKDFFFQNFGVFSYLQSFPQAPLYHGLSVAEIQSLDLVLNSIFF